MKTTAITAIFALLGGVATAQTPAAFKQHLAAPVQIDSLRTLHNTVQVTEHGRAADLIKAAEGNERRSVGGYRIVIFMSNAPTARAEAMAARENFDALYPDETSHISYDNPYFKVAVGNCTTQEEAIMLMERVRSNFPKAFMMRERISATDIMRRQPMVSTREQPRE